jgi:hypothetical protein
MKLRVIILFFVLVNLFGFDGIKFYNNGEYKKAEKAFIKYIKQTDSVVAKAFLAKIYYKEGKYNKAKKLIKELLNDPSVPLEVKTELKYYLMLMEGNKKFSLALSAGVLYDSNVKWDSLNKKSDLVHIEELIGDGSYIKNDFETSIDFKIQNRGYFQYTSNNYIYLDTNVYLTYYSLINSRLKLGYKSKTTESNSAYISELYLFKRYNDYETGVFAIGEYYENNDLNNKNFGGGLRFGLLKDNFKTELSLMSYYSNANDKYLDNRNYKVDIRSTLVVSNYYFYVNYYYNLSKFHDFVNNIHYLDASFNAQADKNIYYSLGITNYDSIIDSFDYEIRKYEIYTKLTYYF